MDPPASHNVSVYRATQDTACCVLLRLRDSHPLRLNFPVHSASNTALYGSPTTPDTLMTGLGCSAFARHYSQNPLFSSPYLDVSVRALTLPISGMMWHYPQRVSPFGHLRLLRSYTPHRSFSQYNASFFGTRYLGIHCAPLFAFRNHCTESPALLACATRYYLRVDYSLGKTHTPALTGKLLGIPDPPPRTRLTHAQPATQHP